VQHLVFELGLVRQIHLFTRDHLGDRAEPVLRHPVAGGFAAVVPALHAGAVQQQQLHNVESPEDGSLIQRRVAHLRLRMRGWAISTCT
jgi:hypothetical protein